MAAARGKREHVVAARVDDALLAEIDRYQREQERETKRPLSRALVLLELLERWAEERSRARVDRKS